MSDLNFFRNNQKNAPSWAMKKQSYYKGLNSQADMNLCIGGQDTLMGNASVIIDDVGQFLNQTVIWGQQIQIAKDKSYLIVDEVRIDLVAPQQAQAVPQERINKSPEPLIASVGTSTPSIAQNRYSLANASGSQQRNVISTYGIIGQHPEGVSFEGIAVGNRLDNGRLEAFRSGTIRFKNGSTMPLEEYENLSKEERIEHNERSYSVPQFG